MSFIRVAARITGAAVLLVTIPISGATQPIPFDGEFAGRTKRVDNWGELIPKVFSALNDQLFARVVEKAIERQGQEIQTILNWAPNSGVLVEVAIQTMKVAPPGEKPKALLGSGAIVIGAGASPAQVMARHLAKDQLGAALMDNYERSIEHSKFLWITKDKTGFPVRSYGFTQIVRAGGAIRANSKLLEEVTKAERRNLTMDMARSAARIVKAAKAKEKIRELENAALNALQALDEINRKLKSALEEAGRIGSVVDTLAKLGAILTLGSQIALASSAMGPNAPPEVLQATSTEQLAEELNKAKLRGQDAVEAFQKTETNIYGNVIVHQQTLVIELGNQNAPTKYVP